MSVDLGMRRPLPTIASAVVVVGRQPLRARDLVEIASGRARLVLDGDPGYRERLRAGAARLQEHLVAGRVIYGVTTGVGESCTTPVAPDHAAALSLNLTRFHGVGTGSFLGEIEAAGVVAARIASLARGQSAVREVLLERLCQFLERGVLPRIPCEGSVGASGDLTPLSYVAALVIGEREAWWRGRIVPSAEALSAAELGPLTLGPKEALALMNGTSVMTALACLAQVRAMALARQAAALAATLSDVLRGNRAHFDERIFATKPHAGTVRAARWIREDIEYDAAEAPHVGRIQDRYSIRCAPHVIGVLLDAFECFTPWIETELNGVNDNPMILPEDGAVLHGGNFYGGHIAFAMDGLKSAVASVVDLMDRQMVLLCNPTTNAGLPADLVAATGPERSAHHGFKAMQISTSALAAEALKLTMPAASFSRSTESHNQDKVSMGTIAARDCLRVLDLAETVAAMLTLAAAQAVDLRRGDGCRGRSRALRDAVRALAPFNRGDRRQDLDIAAVLAAAREGRLPVGEA